MSEVSDRQPWPVYREFKTMEDHSFRSIVRYFEEHREGIRQLPFDEYFELLVEYANALFETGKYHKHLKASEGIIDWVIDRNIKYYRGVDIFRQTLFKKAASHYNLHQISKAQHIIEELIKMDPRDSKNRRFLVRCFRKRPSSLKQKLRAVCIGFILMSALTISAELLIFRPFYPSWVQSVELLRNILFALGIFVFIAGEGVHRFRSWQSMRKRMTHLTE